MSRTPWGSNGADSTHATTYTTNTDRLDDPYHDPYGIPTKPEREFTKYYNIHSKFRQLIEEEKIQCHRYRDNKYKFNYNFDLFDEATRLMMKECEKERNVDVIHVPESYLMQNARPHYSVNEELYPSIEKHIVLRRVILKNFNLDKLQLILKEDNTDDIPINVRGINGEFLKVATVDKSNIVHIHLSIMSIYNGEGADLFMKILNQAIKIINKNKENFSLIFNKALDCNIDKNKIKIKELMKRISDSQKKLEKAKRSYKLLSKLYQNSDMREDSIRSFEVMEKDKRINKIKVKNNLIYVFTNNIKIDLKKAGIFDIGRYEIVYNLLDGDIRVFNRKKMDGCQHPHINSDGLPCWGNMSTTVPKLLAKLDLVGLTNIVLKYLESYRDGGTHVKMFDFIKQLNNNQPNNNNNNQGRINNAHEAMRGWSADISN